MIEWSSEDTKHPDRYEIGSSFWKIYTELRPKGII
jgi:hypothetical protein